MPNWKSALSALAIVLAALSGTGAMAGPATQVKFETTAGDFIVEIDESRAPLTVANFLQYVRDGFYSGTIFHRVVDGFVIQGGGYTPDFVLKPARPPIANESGNGLGNRRGTIAMARTEAPHSADAQFYVNLADNPMLDPKPTRWGYAVFGEVISGMNVVDEIGHAATGNRGDMQNVPVTPVVITKATILVDPAPG